MSIKDQSIARSPRRIFLRLLGAVPALASAPAMAAIVSSPDADLLRLITAYEAAGEVGHKQADQLLRLNDLRLEALKTISVTAAHTPEGICGKARIAASALAHVMAGTDFDTLARGLLADMGAPLPLHSRPSVEG